MGYQLPKIDDLTDKLSFLDFVHHVHLTVAPSEDSEKQMEHWTLGIPEEAGELAGWYKKYAYRSAPHPKHLILEEVGGLAWYLVAGLAEAFPDTDWFTLDKTISCCGSSGVAYQLSRHGEARTIVHAAILKLQAKVIDVAAHLTPEGRMVSGRYSCLKTAEAFDYMAYILEHFGYSLEEAFGYNYRQIKARRGEVTCNEEQFNYYNVKKVRKPQ